MELDGIIDAYVGPTTVIHMASKDSVAPAELEKLLEQEAVTMSDLKRDDSLAL